MEKTYGKRKAKQVFDSMVKEGKLKDVEEQENKPKKLKPN